MEQNTYTLSFAICDEAHHFKLPKDAGIAFANARSEDGPMVILSQGDRVRQIARALRSHAGFAKAAPRPGATPASDPDRAFWEAYHQVRH